NADRYDDSTAAYNPTLLAAADIQPGHRVLDIGCGTGHITRETARLAAPGGEALGVDLSSSMIDVGRRRAAAEGLDNARLVSVDVDLHAGRRPMRFGQDPEAAFAFMLGQLGWMLEGLHEPGRARALDNLRATLAAHHGADGVQYGSAAWIITARRS